MAGGDEKKRNEDCISIYYVFLLSWKVTPFFCIILAAQYEGSRLAWIGMLEAQLLPWAADSQLDNVCRCIS